MKTHYLKTDSKYYQDIFDRKNKFEYRKNDRNFQVGELLVLQEFENNLYTGREITVKIDYLLDSKDISSTSIDISKDYCIMGISFYELPKPSEIKISEYYRPSYRLPSFDSLLKPTIILLSFLLFALSIYFLIK